MSKPMPFGMQHPPLAQVLAAQHTWLAPPQGLHTPPPLPVHSKPAAHARPMQQSCPEPPHVWQIPPTHARFVAHALPVVQQICALLPQGGPASPPLLLPPELEEPVASLLASVVASAPLLLPLAEPLLLPLAEPLLLPLAEPPLLPELEPPSSTSAVASGPPVFVPLLPPHAPTMTVSASAPTIQAVHFFMRPTSKMVAGLTFCAVRPTRSSVPTEPITRSGGLDHSRSEATRASPLSIASSILWPWLLEAWLWSFFSFHSDFDHLNTFQVFMCKMH
jgi:hypothetical protein